MPDQNGYGRLQLQPENKNGILATHFQFELRRLSNTTFFCQSVNFPGLELTAIEQATIFNPIMRPAGILKHDPLSINFMVDEKFQNWLELYNWLQECSNESDFNKYRGPEKHLNSEAILFIHDSNNNPKFKVTFDNMFPTSLGGLNFQTGTMNSQFQYSAASFEYTTFRFTEI